MNITANRLLGKVGMALSFVIPKDQFGKHRPTSIRSGKNDEAVLEKIIARQEKNGNEDSECIGRHIGFTGHKWTIYRPRNPDH